ncbi:MAG TPA: hypothetical protein DDW49_01490 [Deltaproteobacteria bacterium]|nr:hypothetical protein [Deltaproteobacteria bacterium]
MNVLVACGTPVTAGQGLVIVDAMKMENTITAPVSGVVKAIRVMAGDTVQSGHVLVEIEPDVTGEAASSKVAYNFMPDHHLGPRAQLGYIDEAVDKTHYDQVMQAMRERLHGDAPKLLSYIAEYLRGFDYTQDYLKRVLSLLEEVREPSFPIQQALQAVLNQYLDLQNLYAPNNELRDEFEFFIKNWRKVKGRVSKKMGDVLIANLRHFGIRLGDPILDSNKSVIGYHVLPDGVVVKEHSFINVLLRLRQAWNNGSGRRSIVSRLVRLAGSYRMKDEAIRETLMKLYTNAKDSGAQPVVDAVRDTARQIDVVFAQGFNGSPIPDIYAARHAAFLRGRNLVAPAESARMILAIPSAVPQACSELGLGEAHPIARLAHAYGAQIAALYSPDDRFQIFLFRTGKGPKEKNSLVLYAPYPEAPSVSYDDRGVFVGERGLEDYAIRAAEIMKVYQSIEEKNSIRGGLPLKDHEIILDMQELVREADRNGVPHVFTPLHWDTLGKNVFPFLDRRALYRAAVLANTMDSDGRTTRVAHQYVPTRDGQVFAMRTTRDQYFAIEDSEDRDHHLRGLLTIEERAAKFFDGGHYEVIKLNGVEDSAVLLTVGKVKGREVIAYLSDSRTKKKRGAVGAAEGKVMAAAVMLAYLKGMPVVGLNDSGGAKIPEGTPALNYSGIDFFIKEAAQRTPEEFSRWVEAHPNWAFFKALLDQFGNGRPLIEQLKGKNPPLHIALMMGLNSGMVVYGPAELNHVFMRNSSQVAGMLTGENVVYEVKHVKLSNSDIGGAYVLVRKAGTVDQAVDTEEELFDLARRAIDMFSPGVALGDGIIRRFEGSLEDTKAQNTEATIIHLPTLLRHVDHGFFWPYKGDLLHASEVEAGWTQMGGNTVAILGPKLPGGFGSREAIEKADRFARAAVSENIPLIKIVGEKWYSRSRSGGRDVEKRREELTGFLTRSTHVPQVSIITHARGLQMYNVHEGSHVQIFVKSATTTRHELWLAQRKGCIIVDTFKEAMDYASRFVAYAKASSRQALVSTKDNPDRTADLSFVPTDFNLGYDMRKVIGEVFDQNSFLEIGQSDTNNLQGSNLITGLATMNGRVVGVFADNPQIRAGAADWLGADKFRHFVELCKSLKVPMVYMEDSPGFEPGPEQEGADIQGRGGKLLKEIISADVPKVKFVVRKSFGGRNIQGFHPWLSPGTVALSLTNSLIAVMGARAGIPFVYRKDGAYQTLVGTIVNESKALTTLLDTYQPRQDPGDVKRRLSAFAAQIRAIDENYPFKRLDAIKTILGGLDEIISLDETPGQTISPIREKIYLFRELVRRVDELIGKYNKDVADPAKSLTVAKAGDLVRGYLDGIIEPSTSRQAMQEALTLAEKRAAARTRPYAALTRDESRLAHARGRLADLGLHARFVVEDAKNAGRDLLILDGTERFMTSAEVHEVLNVLDELDGKSENAAKFVTYANGDVDKRELLKTEWKSQREKETVRRVALQRPQNLADALLAAVQAADPEQLNNLASQLASVVGALQASTAHLLPLVAALAPAFLAAQFQMRMEFVRTRLVAQIKGGEMRLSSRDMHEELAVYLPELFQLSKADDLEDFIGSLARNALAKIISQGGEGIGADSAQRKCVLVRRVAEDSAYIPIFVFNVSDLSAGSIERVMEDSAIDKRALRIGVYEPFNDRAIKLVLLLDAETNDEDRLRLLVEKLELFKTEGIASIEVWQGQGPDVVRYRYSVNESGITLESSLHLNHLAGAAVTGNGDTPVHSGPRRRILPVAQQAAVSRIPVKEIQKGGQTGGGNPEALSRSTVIGDRTLIPAGDIFGRRRHNHDVMQNGWVEPANGDALDRVLDAADAKTDDATVANGDGAAKTKKSPVGAGFPRPHSAPIRHWSSLAAMRAGGGIRSITSHPGFRPVGR